MRSHTPLGNIVQIRIPVIIFKVDHYGLFGLIPENDLIHNNFYGLFKLYHPSKMQNIRIGLLYITKSRGQTPRRILVIRIKKTYIISGRHIQPLIPRR